jgi:fibronectin-binding autotransporter adhesin
MNRIYRLVWNRALRVLQVASELARAPRSDNGATGTRLAIARRRTLALACAAALAAVALPAWSATCPAGSTSINGTGSAGSAGQNGSGGAGSNGGSGYMGTATSLCVATGNTLIGGFGGNGGNSTVNGVRGGSGGSGGTGVSGAGFTLTNDGTITGGGGGFGGGGSDGGGGGGGSGGTGISANGPGSTLTNDTGANITGGNGGSGGTGVSGAGFTLTNDGNIKGGDGYGGSGGAGVASSGSSTIVNAGYIYGGKASGGNGTQADAVDFSGGGNTLTLENGYTFVGNVISSSGSTNGGDTLVLGGTTADSFDLSSIAAAQPTSWTGAVQYYGFNQYAKTGSSTWTLTGTSTTSENWTILDGTLQLGNGISGDDGAIDGGIQIASGATFAMDEFGNIALANMITGAGAVSLQSGSTITQSGPGTITAATLTGSSVGGTTLNDANSITNLGNFTAAGFSLTNGQALTVAAGDTVNGGSSTSLTTTTGDLTINGTVIGTTTTTLTSAGAIGEGTNGVVNATTLTGSSVGDTTLDGANLISTLGSFSAQDFSLTNAQALTVSGTLTTTGGTGNISLTTTNGALTLNTALSGINDLNLSSAGGIILNDDVTTTGTQTYTGAVTLGGTDTLTGTDVSLAGGVTGGGNGLTITGNTTLGTATGLSTLSVSGTSLLNGNVTTTGTQTYTGAVTLGGTDTLTGTDVSLAGGVTGGGNGLTIAGNTTLGTATGLSTLSVSGTSLLNGNVTTTGTQTYTGAVTLADNTTLTSTGNGAITLSGNVNALNNLTVDSGSLDSLIAGTISGSGTLTTSGTGTLVLDGVNTYTGLTTVASGTTLIVGDSSHTAATVGGDVSVNGGTLGGYGTIQGSATLSNGSTLTPGAARAIGTLTVNGDLTIGSGSQLDFDFGAPGPNFSTPGQSDHVVVNGNLTIDSSTLNVSNLGSMGPGLYNLFTWGQSLSITGGGFAPPSGMSLQILTVDKQINLVDTQGLTLDEWDANGQAGPGAMGGGSGTWSVSSNTWSDTTGQFVGPMAPQPGFAIFGGTAGTVTVDDTNGVVSVAGMQFVSDGYHLTGDAIDLVEQGGVAPVLRVSSGDTAIIDNELDGADGFNKTDGGTLVLTGTNLYTGTTTLSGGYLSVSSDANLGAAADPLDFEGGTLEITGTSFNQTARSIIWGSAGGGFDIDDAANTFTVTQALSGTGGLLKSGAGTLVLAGANTYSGGTIIDAGILQGDTSSLQGDITDNATLVFAQTGSGSFSGAISGSGTLIKNGGGMLILSGTNTYTGGTTINAGTLQGDTTSLQGNIANNAALMFDQASNGTYSGVITGTGSLTKSGDGTLSLTGANVYSGGTTISAGALQGDTTSLQGNIADNAALVFNQNSAGTFAGVVSGSGSLTQSGSGVLTLTGVNTYSGGTTISAGTLQIGNGGSSGAITGAVVDNGSLAFDRSDAVSFAGVISGIGALVQNGTGTLTLTGTNTYTGGTTISAGTLQGDSTSLQGNIADNAALVFNQNSAGTFAGVVSGSGSLTQSGSGVLTLTGINTYTGGTTIATGTLQGDSSSLQGNLTDNATLVFNQGSNGLFAGSISGSGTLTKTGAGLLVFDGASPFTGSTTVQAGTLEVGDAATPTALLGSDVQVAAGGTLRGHGTIGGNVVNDGNLWPGGSIGTLTVQGNYTQSVGSIFTIDATPAGQASLLTVGGTASILGGNAVVLAQSGTWAPQTNYTILTAAGGLNGQFASASSSLIFLDPVLTYSANAVNLSLQRNDISFASVAQTPNQIATANAAEDLGFGNAAYSALTLLDAATARHAFDQLSGVIYPDTTTALIDDSRYVRDTINRHLLGLNNDGTEGTTDDGVSAWTSAWGHGGHNDSDGNAPLMQANGSGMLLGADLPVAGTTRLGAVVGYGQNAIQSNSVGSDAHVLGDHAGLYGSSTFGAFELRAGAVYSWQDIHSNRAVAFGDYSDGLTSEHHAQTAQAYVEGGYPFNVSPGQQLEPFVNVARVYVHDDAVQEGGGDAALAVAGNSASVNTATLGLRDTLALDAAGGIHAHASLGWQQAWGDLTPVSTMRFESGGDSFDIAGVPLARHAVTTDLGIDFKVAKNVTFDASYLGQFASGVQDQGARMSLTVTF